MNFDFGIQRLSHSAQEVQVVDAVSIFEAGDAGLARANLPGQFGLRKFFKDAQTFQLVGRFGVLPGLAEFRVFQLFFQILLKSELGGHVVGYNKIVIHSQEQKMR